MIAFFVVLGLALMFWLGHAVGSAQASERGWQAVDATREEFERTRCAKVATCLEFENQRLRRELEAGAAQGN